MAQTIKGLDVVVKIGNTVIGGQKNGSLEISSDVTDTTTKQSGGWKENEAVLTSWSSSCEGLFYISDQGYKAALDAMIAKQPVELEFSNTSKTFYRKGKALITSLSESAGQDGVVAYSTSFTGTGPLTITNSSLLNEAKEK